MKIQKIKKEDVSLIVKRELRMIALVRNFDRVCLQILLA